MLIEKLQNITNKIQKEIEELINLLFQNKYKRIINKKKIQRLIKNKNNHILVAKKEKEIIGIALLIEVQTLSRKAGFLEEVIINKQYRNKGIGYFLILEILKIAKKEKLDCIECVTSNYNKEALSMYKKAGFVERKQTPMYKILRKWKNHE